MIKKTPKFILACEAAAKLINETIDPVLTWHALTRKTYVYEDDGVLHVEKSGLHVCFGIGQDRPLREQNERMTKVLTHLGLMKHIDYALWSKDDVEQEETEDNECPECGRDCCC